MENKIQKKDFIELEYSGSIKNGEVFDTNIKEDAKKLELDAEFRPLVICIGEGMILPAIDEFLEGKELGKYTLDLTPAKSFGERSREMIKTMPLRIFIEKQIMPQPGMVFQFDTLLGKISAVSGGRVIVDFNNPLAGKDVTYTLNAKRKVEDIKERVEVLIALYFRRKLEFEIVDKKVIIKVEKQFAPLIGYYAPKFKDLLGLDLEVKEIELNQGSTTPIQEKEDSTIKTKVFDPIQSETKEEAA